MSFKCLFVLIYCIIVSYLTCILNENLQNYQLGSHAPGLWGEEEVEDMTSQRHLQDRELGVPWELTVCSQDHVLLKSGLACRTTNLGTPKRCAFLQVTTDWHGMPTSRCPLCSKLEWLWGTFPAPRPPVTSVEPSSSSDQPLSLIPIHSFRSQKSFFLEKPTYDNSTHSQK